LSAPGTAAPSGEAAVPGKRTLVEEWMANAVHQREHRHCSDPGATGCFLEEEDRDAVYRRLDSQIHEASANWRSAITDARLVKLCQHETGWNAFWEIGFYAALAGASLGVGAGVAALAKAAPMMTSVVKPALLLKIFGTAARGLRIPLRVDINASANHGNSMEAEFLHSLQAMPSQWATAVYNQSLELEDADLITMVNATDPNTSMSFDHFEAEIARLLRRFGSQVVDVGKKEGMGMFEESCAWITPRGGGAPRLARVVRNVGSGDISAMRATIFRSWVDPDMEAMAIAEWEKTSPGQGIETVTLGDLQNVPAPALAWERAAEHAAFRAPDPDEPHTATSHEDPRK
jgi:hypothetical protein